MLYFYHYVFHQDISQTNILLVPIIDKIQDRYDFLIDIDYAMDVAANTLLCKLIDALH